MRHVHVSLLFANSLNDKEERKKQKRNRDVKKRDATVRERKIEARFCRDKC